MTPKPIGQYPAKYTHWNNQDHTLKLPHLDKQIAEHTRSNFGLTPEYIDKVSRWDDAAELKPYRQIPLQQLVSVAGKSQLQFRALFALSIIWAIKEGHRAKQSWKFRNTYIYATTQDGAPRPEALRRMPHFTPTELAQLCYTEDQWEYIDKHYRYKAKQTINALHDKGYIHIIRRSKLGTQIARPYAEPWIQT